MVRQPQSGNNPCQIYNRDEDSDLGGDGPWKPAWCACWCEFSELRKTSDQQYFERSPTNWSNDGGDKNSVKKGMVVMLLFCKTWHETKTHLDWCSWGLNPFMKTKNLNSYTISSLKWSIFFQLFVLILSHFETKHGHTIFSSLYSLQKKLIWCL